MSERTDRRLPASPWLIALVMAFTLGAAGVGLYWWLRAAPSDAPPVSGQALQNVSQALHGEEPLIALLYFPVEGTLAVQKTPVKRQPDAQLQAREVVVAQFADPRAAQIPVLRDVKLRALYVDASGTAYIDLALSPQKELRASAGDELLVIYGLVNTLMQNIEEIKLVHFLLDGKEAQTLAGHMDLSRTFTKRMDLVKQ